MDYFWYPLLDRDFPAQYASDTSATRNFDPAVILFCALSGRRRRRHGHKCLLMPLAEAAGACDSAARVFAPRFLPANRMCANPLRWPLTIGDGFGWSRIILTPALGTMAFDTNRRDRILIFEDSKGTGHFDKRKVFWDQGVRLTGIALGFGGVFCTCAPNLIFIPDRNGDDIPDGPPEILLDGWNADQMHHTIVNGLKWGPDGWLYGRQGIAANSDVGIPGAPEGGRTKLNCAIWRYHPTRKIFEVVCQGGTNPWGHDWDQYGELFFVNTVIGHLWHGIPGAFYKRMFGEHLEPYRYGLIDQTADHYHWNTGKSWTDARGVGDSDALGGGHAHSGLMIYLADNWPEEYYGHLFMLNFHGRRINQDVLERRKGSGIRWSARNGLGSNLAIRGFKALIWIMGRIRRRHRSGLVGARVGRMPRQRPASIATRGEFHKLTSTKRRTESSWNEGPLPSSLLTNSLAALSPMTNCSGLQSHPNEWVRASRPADFAGARVRRFPHPFRAKILKSLQGAQTNIPKKLRLLFTLHAVDGDSKEVAGSSTQRRRRACSFVGDALAGRSARR